MSASDQTIIELLLRDHAKAEALLRRIDSIAPTDMSQYFCELREELVRHEVAEEMILYPAFRENVPLADAVADARIEEQSEAERELAKLEREDPANAEFRSQLLELRGAVLEHAKAEELEVFPAMSEHTPHKELLDLGRRYEEALERAPTHPHPHAPDTPPGNVVAGPVAALVDRIRDAIRGAA